MVTFNVDSGAKKLQMSNNFFRASLCINKHNTAKIVKGRKSKPKVIGTNESELMKSANSKIATKTNSSNTNPSNALRSLLMYGLI